MLTVRFNYDICEPVEFEADLGSGRRVELQPRTMLMEANNHAIWAFKLSEVSSPYVLESQSSAKQLKLGEKEWHA